MCVCARMSMYVCTAPACHCLPCLSAVGVLCPFISLPPLPPVYIPQHPLWRRAWIALVGLEAAAGVLSVCIGSTSARAAHAAGLTRVSFPDSPSMDAWVDCVLQGLRETGRLPAEGAA